MDNNFRQELRSPTTGQIHVVGNASEAARLRSQGYERVVDDAPAGPYGEPPKPVEEKPATEQKPPRGAAAKKDEASA